MVQQLSQSLPGGKNCQARNGEGFTLAVSLFWNGGPSSPAAVRTSRKNQDLSEAVVNPGGSGETANLGNE